MTTLVDANVLLDIFTADELWEEWSRQALKSALLQGVVVINPIIYAEVSLAFTSERELADQLRLLSIQQLPLPYGAAFPAGRAFLRYRRQGGSRRSPLPDFYIGAHAQVEELQLLTRDASRFRTYFPTVSLLAPEE